MDIVRSVFHAMVPTAVALSAFFQARGIDALARLATTAPSTSTVVTTARATALAPTKSADPILDRNPFDHETGSLRGPASEDVPPSARDAPPCEATRPLFLVKADDPNESIAALEVSGQRVLRRRGGELAGMRVVYIGLENVWLETAKGLCQAGVFTKAKETPKVSKNDIVERASALEASIATKIEETAPNEFVIDRSALDRIFESQGDLTKPRLIPEKDGDRVLGLRLGNVKPGSVVAKLGLKPGDRLESVNGFDVTNTEKMFEAYARIHGGAADRITIHLTRGGRPTDLSYAIR